MRVFFGFALLAFIPALAFAEPRAGCAELRRTARFTVYFERVDLEKLVQTVSDATCRSFLLGENVKGKISIVGPENGKVMLDADQFYAAFLAALDVNGFTAVTQGRFTRIIEKPRARQFPVPVMQDGEAFPSPNEIVTRVFHLKHVDVETLRAPIAAFVSQGGDLLPVPPDVLIVTDLVSNLQRIEKLLTMLDVERASTEVTKLVTVKHAAADELLDKVTRALAPRPGVKPSETLTSLADDRTNRLLFTGSAALVDRALSLVEQLDIDVPGDSRARVYRLRSADAKELAATLEAMTSAGKAKQPGPAMGEVRISVNEALNALLIVSSAGDYRALSEVIAQLDQPVRQVFIETVIMEVNLQRDAQFALSMHGLAGTAETPSVFGWQPEGGPSSLSLKSLATSTGLLAGLQGPALAGVSKALGLNLSSFGFALQASQSNSDVNILSTPHILTADNKEAEIAVGQRVPFQLGVNQSQLAAALASGNSTAVNSTALTGSISREKVELRLIVRPHIGAGEDIRMEVNQTAEELAGTSTTAGPITSTRSQKTTVVAKNEETIVLGGIMQDRELEHVSKVPVLGDIPLIGQLFRSTSKTKTKVNLLVFLTPHIIYDTNDFKRLVERKMTERTKLIEQFYGERGELERTIDFGRKPGPVAALARAITREQARPENGGQGGPGDTRVEPHD